MKVSLIQSEIVWADKQANLRNFGEKIAALAGKTDLVILPEMFTTGFCIDRPDLAEEMHGETMSTLRKWATDYHLAITGSVIISENNHLFNRAFFVYPDGKTETADKKHLFSVGQETDFFKAGNKRMIVDYRGFNICVLVCYDIRFPVWSRNLDLAYDLLIYVANFPAKRINDWDVLLRARAVENQAFVCGVNRVGVDGAGVAYNGHSQMLDYHARELATFPDDMSGVAMCEIQKEPLDHYRKKFPVWRDADK